MGSEARYRSTDTSHHHGWSTRRDSATVAHPDDVHPDIGPRHSRTPNRARSRMSHPERLVHGSLTQLDYSLPTPSPSPRAPFRASIQFGPDPQEAEIMGRSRQLPSEPTATSRPTHVASGALDPSDIYSLDASMVQLRNPNCNPVIHRPPRGEMGSQRRWYFVSCGRKVGVFNEWFSTPLRLKLVPLTLTTLQGRSPSRSQRCKRRTPRTC